MSKKTYPLGSSEAMEIEPRLDEEFYLSNDVKKKILKDEYLQDVLREAEDMAFYFNQLVEETRK